MSSNKETLTDGKTKLEVSRDSYMRHNSVCVPHIGTNSSSSSSLLLYQL